MLWPVFFVFLFIRKPCREKKKPLLPTEKQTQNNKLSINLIKPLLVAISDIFGKKQMPHVCVQASQASLPMLLYNGSVT
jgi:hypothetical protein